jgi:hypothetical protein
MAAAVTIAVAIFGLAWGFDRALGTFWLFGLAFGFVLQRSRFCFRAAYQELFLRRRARMLKAILAGLAVTTAGFGWVMYGRVAEPLLGFRPIEAHVVPLGLSVAVGGLLFGLGMVLSGGCLSRSMCHMGEGYVASWLTIGAVLVGLSLTAHTWNFWWLTDMQYRELVWMPNRLGYGGALLLTFAALAVIGVIAHLWEARGASAKDEPDTPVPPTSPLRRSRARVFGGAWPPVVGGVLLGALNVALYVGYQPWGVTGELSRWADAAAGAIGLSAGPLLGVEWMPMGCMLSESGGELLTQGLMLNVGLIVGSLVAALGSGEFRIRTSDGRYYARSIVGGVIMGYGAGLAVGCTIGGLFSAIPSLALNGWLFALTLTLGAYVGFRIVD